MFNEQMKIYEDYLNMLFEGYENSVLCHSKAGYGKTYSTIKILKKNEKDYTYISGVTTAVALYKILYENKNSILVLDDVETIFQSDRIVNLLKSALWNVDGKRKVSYKTSSKTLEDYPDKFTYKGKIIILANEIYGKNDKSFDALLSRCLKYELKYEFNEIINISKQIVEEKDDISKKQKNKINYILDNKIKKYVDFNFRLLERLISFVKYDIDKAEKLFFNSININGEKKLLINILQKYDTVKKQIRKFKKKTGYSRATFFRKKKKLKKEGLIK